MEFIWAMHGITWFVNTSRQNDVNSVNLVHDFQVDIKLQLKKKLPQLLFEVFACFGK